LRRTPCPDPEPLIPDESPIDSEYTTPILRYCSGQQGLIQFKN
jgi:hypothetical protein